MILLQEVYYFYDVLTNLLLATPEHKNLVLVVLQVKKAQGACKA